VGDLCTGAGSAASSRVRILTWLADGAREIIWALCSLPRDRWIQAPPTTRDGEWSALRHARSVALRDSLVTLPIVRQALGEAQETELCIPGSAEFVETEASWDPAAALDAAESLVRGIGENRFELLQRLEAAPDEAWHRPLPLAVAPDTSGVVRPVQLDWLLLHARQQELEHLAAIWRVALYWDRVAQPVLFDRRDDKRMAGLPLHPADRLEESD
jgi:hypothetical protein